MRRTLTYILAAFPALLPFGEARGDGKVLETANSLYDKAHYDSAATLYRQLIRNGGGKESVAVATFNLGNTHFRKKQFEEASRLFAATAGMEDISDTFRTDALFNAGTALANMALSAGERNEKRKLLESALNRYRSALLLHPGDRESKINHEITLRLLETLSSPPPAGRGGGSGTETTPSSGDAASGILDKAEREERELLRNRRPVPTATRAPSPVKEW
ncbi:hypothetical protein CHL67_11040 [Prosthecochloris sp. GSB1]|uniref:tetratricopeptide repeat protein n=1 Tax=Prosthecochloris sp. GSB1 TaxID=281093 RepID=UPI000B8D11F5|nr:tetratricopeptide repeat protein [Prosthecochloris sp. GSB1]ASQ91381.1 hypothetical protein CHL67_11040 [Prosthecochloris sp. GSB1]